MSLESRIERLEAEAQRGGGVVVIQAADGQEDAAAGRWCTANPEANPGLLVIVRKFSTSERG